MKPGLGLLVFFVVGTELAGVVTAAAPASITASPSATTSGPATIPARGRGRGPATTGPVTLNQLAIRDVCILPDPATKTYYMVGPSGRGVREYSSKDLFTWTGPTQIYTAPTDVWGSVRLGTIWAPEIHKYKDKYYLFLTFDTSSLLPATADVAHKPAGSNRPLVIRGSTTAVSESVTGPFKVVQDHSIPPTDMMTLDGTFWEEDNQPYMVFSHEWVQCAVGEMWAIKLKEDLSAAADKPFLIFKSSEAGWAKVQQEGGTVTDGPYMRKGKTGKLYMVWSSFDDRPGGHRYQVGISISDSGKLAGPWRQQNAALMPEVDGGHSMLFETFDGRLMMVLHSPGNGNTHPRIFEMEDTGETLKVVKELSVNP
jgi:arabinan endo-1,5-alpha-L-arabinosidase